MQDGTSPIIKVTKLSKKEKAAFYSGPSGFICDNIERLKQFPDSIDLFLVDQNAKLRLLFGLDVGDPTSRLRYALDENGNLSRFRYDHRDNKRPLGPITKNETNISRKSVNTVYLKINELSIGLRFQLELAENNFEIYALKPDGSVRFHDLKTGESAGYYLDKDEFKQMENKGWIRVLNYPDPIKKAAQRNNEPDYPKRDIKMELKSSRPTMQPYRRKR